MRQNLISLHTGMKGIGKSNLIENRFKDHSIIETPNKNRQSKSFLNDAFERISSGEKILIKTHPKFLKNKYNRNRIVESKGSGDFVILIEDINRINELIKSNRTKIKSKLNFKDSDVYQILKNG